MMKQLKESILDSDFNITGVELISYDWMEWPACEDLAERIYACNNNIFSRNLLPRITQFREEMISDIEKASPAFEKRIITDLINDIKVGIGRLSGKIESMGNYSINNMSSRIKMFEFVDELLSQPCGKIIKKEQGDNIRLSIASIKDDPKLKIILRQPQQLPERDKNQIFKDIENVCKKHRFKYEENTNPTAVWWSIKLNV